MTAPDERDTPEAPATRGKKGDLTTRILASLALGIACGLFFGEPMGIFGALGDAYVGLLQMTVLPFITVSLVANIGRFESRQGVALARIGAAALAVLLLVGALTLAVYAYALPKFETGSFFTAALVEEPPRTDFLSLYVPSNPFHSLAANLVPAVVLFSILLGVAVATLENKALLLDQLDLVAQGLVKINGWVVRLLSPFGVFAIAAGTAGTIRMEEFQRLQAYFLVHTTMVAFLVFVLVPMGLAAITPLTYRSILRETKDFLVTAFVTGSLFAVLPILLAAIDRLLESHGWDPHESAVSPDVLVPLAYSFPTLGKVTALFFVPFAAWYVGSPLEAVDYPLFLSAGIFVSFGSLVVSIPFLMNLFQVPIDLFQLFLAAGVWSARVSDLAGGMHILAFAVLVMAALSGRLRLDSRALVRFGVVGGLVCVASVVGLRAWIASSLDEYSNRESVLATMQALKSDVPTRVFTVAEPNPVPLEPGRTRLDRARARGAIRIGYDPRSLPFAFFNINGELVGFDIDMAARLADDLDVALELVPIEPGSLGSQLHADHFDLAMSGIAATGVLAGDVLLSDAYLDLSVALVVPDHRKRDFSSLSRLRQMDGLTLGVAADGFFEERIRERLPRAEVVSLEWERDFFEARRGEMDALVTSAEGGSAWTLMYQGYTVVTPVRPPTRIPLAYAMAGDDESLDQFLETWIDLKKKDGTIDRRYDYWILGRDLEKQEPRWSVLRNVLGVGG